MQMSIGSLPVTPLAGLRALRGVVTVIVALALALAAAGAAAVTSGSLLVRLSDGLSGQVLSDTNVVVWEILENGDRVFAGSRLTDGSGEATFSILGLGDGRRFVVRTRPYLDLVEQEVTASGTVELQAGKLQLRVLNGITGAALAATSATLVVEEADGSVAFAGRYTTDANGRLRLDPPALGQRVYRLRVASPVDGSDKLSAPFPRGGRYAVRAGNPPVELRFVDFLSGQPRSRLEVQTQELLADGTRVWRRSDVTDADGRLILDLDGLQDGRAYVVRARPFVQWIERAVAAPGPLEIPIGTLTARLVDEDRGVPLAGVEMQLQRKLPDGSLVWQGAGTTGSNGVVRFDPEELPSEAAVYLLTVNGPFGGSQRYLSNPVVAPGPVIFPVRRAGPEPVDLRPPTLEVVASGPTVPVGTRAFSLLGYAGDDAVLRDVQVELRGPRGEVQFADAAYDPDSTRWTLQLTPDWFRAGDTVAVTVRARDGFFNAVSLALALRVIDDLSAPVIRVLSHTSGATVHDRGVLLRGTALDETEVSELTATVLRGTTVLMPERPVERVPGAGQWALALPAELFQGRAGLRVRLRATDSSGNRASLPFDLSIDPDTNAIPHLVARTSFGESPAALAQARSLGYGGYVDSQLAPALIDDSQLEAMLAAEPRDTAGGLRRHLLLRAAYSERQLQEVMTWFWENHFNTDLSRHGQVAWEAQENDALRANALGRFRDLLEVSARSPAMLYYLDGVRNRARRINENYGRELLELHTLGVNGGYTQDDVVAVARALTGWTVRDGQFHFDPELHDQEPKTVLGVALSGTGIEEGEQVLDLLAAHPETARHVCGKLVVYLLADEPPEPLVERCANVFRSNAAAPDQLARVVAAVLKSSQFRGAAYRDVKMKTPLRFLAGMVRTLGATASSAQLVAELEALGQTPFQYPVPTGYSERAADWASADLLISRLALVGGMLESRSEGTRLHLAITPLLAEANVVPTAEGIAGHLLVRLNNGEFTQQDLDAALEVMSEGGAIRFDVRASAAGDRLTRLLRSLLSLPRYHLY